MNNEKRPKRLRIIWRTRRWRTKIFFARRGPRAEMSKPAARIGNN